MKINIKGEPNDIIRRCDGCNYCIFEDILSPEQRKIVTIRKKNPKMHIHRAVIEQLCKKQYDEVCPMKYAAMKATIDDRTAVQIAMVTNYIWDFGKRHKEKIEYSVAIKKWTELQDLGRKKKESRAERFNEIWRLGVRNIIIDNILIENQILTADLIYEIIMTTPDNYVKWLKILDKLKEEHKERDEL